MASPTPDREPSLGDRSPADLVRGGASTRAKLLKELSLWVVAALAAGAGALGMQLGGTWGWSLLAFGVTLAVLLLVRLRVLVALDRRTEAEKAAARAADERAARLAAERRREERDLRRHYSTPQRPHKPRGNPYRRKDS